MVAAGVIVGAGTNLDRASEVWTRGVAGEGVEVLGVRVREAMRDTGPGGEAMRDTGPGEMRESGTWRGGRWFHSSRGNQNYNRICNKRAQHVYISLRD